MEVNNGLELGRNLHGEHRQLIIKSIKVIETGRISNKHTSK